jgi:MFS family permease
LLRRPARSQGVPAGASLPPQGVTAGVIFLFSCSVMGLATGIPAWAALLVLAAAIALHTFGELWHSSASFAMDFGLAPQHAQGQYQGLITVGNGAGNAAAPVLLIGFFLSLGRLGFVLLGACFALLGLLGPIVAAWGERTRPAAPGARDRGRCRGRTRGRHQLLAFLEAL